MALPSILNLIQKENTVRIRQSSQTDLIPMVKIAKDEYGYFLKTVDIDYNEKSFKIDEVAPRFRSFIAKYEAEVKQLWTKVSWGEENEELYLQNNEYLLQKLPKDALLLDRNNQLLKWDEDQEVTVQFAVIAKGDFYSIELQCVVDDQITNVVEILSETYAIVNGSLTVLAEPILNAHYIPSILGTKATEAELPIVLSVICSYISSDIVMVDYKKMTLTNLLSAQKTIIFDKVDEDNNMYLRVSQTLENVQDADVLEKYKLTKIININHERKLIVIQPVDKLSDEQVYQEFVILLKNGLSVKNSKRLGLMPPSVIMDDELALLFLQDILPNILDEYEVLGQEKLKGFKISASKPKLNANLSSGLDYLEGDVTLDFDGEEIDVFAAINMWKKNKYIKLKNGQNVIVAKDYINKLQRIFSKKDGKVQLSFFDLPIAEDLLKDQLESSVFKKHRDVFEGFNTIKTIRNSKKINATLRDYQKYGVGWMQYLHDNNLNGCLADDMGLGKTLQSLGLLALNPSKNPTLIIMPRTLLYNWDAEIKNLFQDYRIIHIMVEIGTLSK